MRGELLTCSLLICAALCGLATESSDIDGATAADLTVAGEIGDFVTLPCRVGSASRFDHLRWFGPHYSTIPLTIGDVTFATDSRISVERESRGHDEFLNLIISFVSANDAGLYRCCCHGSPSAEQTVLLKVVSRPTVVEHRSKLTTKVPQLVRLGDNVTLECSTHLDRRQHQQQDVDLDWVKPGAWPDAARTRPSKRLSSVPPTGDVGADGGFQQPPPSLQLTAMLTIPTVRLSDAGVYECRRYVIGSQKVWKISDDNVARITLRVHLSRSQHKHFLSTTTAAAVRPTRPSIKRLDSWHGSDRGNDDSRVLNDGQSQSPANQLRSNGQPLPPQPQPPDPGFGLWASPGRRRAGSTVLSSLRLTMALSCTTSLVLTAASLSWW